MKRIVLIAATLSFGLLAPAAQAQQPAPGGVALVDLAYIFKNHLGLKAMKADLQTAMQAAEVEYKSRGQQFQAQTERLKELQQGTPEYKTLETALIKEQASLNSQLSLKRKQFIEEEARMMYDVYREILEEVSAFSQRNQINLVLQFNGEPLTSQEPQQVLDHINNPVVYHTTSVDITPVILQQLNRRNAAAAGLQSRGRPTGQPTQRR